MRLKMLSVVVPTYNESENVKKLLEEIENALKDIPYEVIFVDDSTDDTPELLEKIAGEDSRVRYEHRTEKKGLATAVLRGFELAKGDYVACMDADLQHPPVVLRSMYVAMCEGADMCIPSRFVPGGSDGGLDPYRKLVSGTARYIGKILLTCLRRISDPTSGLFMFKKEIIEGADLQPIGWKIMIEVLAMGKFSKVIELPYTFQDRNAGESKLSTKVTLEYLKQLFCLIPRAVDNDITVKVWSEKRLEKELAKLDRFIEKKKND